MSRCLTAREMRRDQQQKLHADTYEKMLGTETDLLQKPKIDERVEKSPD